MSSGVDRLEPLGGCVSGTREVMFADYELAGIVGAVGLVTPGKVNPSCSSPLDIPDPR